MSKLATLIILSLAFAVPCIAFGADIYIAQSAAGSANGSSCANAYAYAWFNTNAPGAGDTVHVCGTISSQLKLQGGGASGKPVAIKFEPQAKLSAPTLASGGQPIFLDLQSFNYVTVDGGGSAGMGGIQGNPALANGIIELTDNGSPAASGWTGYHNQNDIMGIYAAGTNITIQNLVIQNLYVRQPGSSTDSNAFGYPIIASGGINTLIQNCIIHDGYGCIFVNYVNGLNNIKLINNTLYNTNHAVSVGPQSNDLPAITASGLQISGNRIDHLNVWQSGAPNFFHIDGIFLFNETTNFAGNLDQIGISGNIIGPNMGTNCTAEIYVSTPGNAQQWTNLNIYNNVLLVDVAGGQACGNGALAVGGEQVGIYNNTVIGAQSSGQYGGAFLTLGQTGKGAIVEGNLIYNLGTLLSEGGGVGGTTGEVALSDFNLLYGLTPYGGAVGVSWTSFRYTGTGTFTNKESVSCSSGGTARFFRQDKDAEGPGTIDLRNIVGNCNNGDTIQGTSSHASVTLSSAGTGIGPGAWDWADWVTYVADAHSLLSDPKLNNTDISSFDPGLQSGSPAMGAFTTGEPTTIFTTDILGNPRKAGAWSIGARELAGAPGLSPPKNLRVVPGN